MKLIVLVLALVAIGTMVFPSLAAAWEVGNPLIDPCLICQRYGFPPACWQCMVFQWWANGDCFPGDPGCY